MLVLHSLPTCSVAGEWKAGTARVKITPDQPLVLSGKFQRDRPSAGALHDLWAKALALEDAGGRRVVLVTLDLVGIDRNLSQAVCADLRRRSVSNGCRSRWPRRTRTTGPSWAAISRICFSWTPISRHWSMRMP